MNVIPFVRQHTSAKTLWEQLLYLYGKPCGIDTVGGPAVFGVMDMKGEKLQVNARNMSEMFADQMVDDEERLLLDAPVVSSGRRLASEPSLGLGVGIVVSNTGAISLPKEKQQVGMTALIVIRFTAAPHSDRFE